MNPETVLSILAELRSLPYFPADPEVMTALLRLVGNMCETEAQVRWLVNRMTNGLYSEWPGPAELRACFCSRFKPKDGIELCSTVYPDGIPSERANLPQLAGPELPALPPGRKVTADAVLDSAVVKIAGAKAMPAVRPLTRDAARFARDLEEILTAPCDREPLPALTPQIITQQDIDRAVAEYRASNEPAGDVPYVRFGK